MRLIEKSITSSVYDTLNESTNYLKKYTNKIDKMSDKALYKAWLEVSEAPTEEKKYDKFGACVEVTDTMASDALWEIEGELCRRGYMDEDSNKTDKWKELEENIKESFDPDKTAKRVARYKEFDNGHVLHSWLEDKTADEVEELARQESIKNPEDVYYVQYDDVMNSSNDIRWLNGEKYVGGGFHYMDGKPIHHTDEEFDLVHRGEKTWEDIANARMNESYVEEEVKNRKKVTKVEVTILPEVKFVWAEGSQDIVKSFFGSAEEHTMKFSDFQNSIYAFDSFIAEGGGGYNKVKYVSNIKVVFTYEDGSTDEEVTTYTGRLDCGDGYEYVTIAKNMKYFIRGEFKDADIYVNEETTGTKESDLNDETAAYEVDMEIDGDVEEAVEEMLKSNNAEGVQYKVVTLSGPGGGWPVVRFYGNKVKVEKFLKNIGYEDLDAYKKENMNESATYEVDMAIEDNLEDEINELLKSNKADGVQYKVVNTQGVGGGWPTVRFYGEDNKVKEFLGNIGFEDTDTYRVDESNINESEETGKMTMAEYALKVKDGEFDSDVSDTEIDMMVYYYCDFKEEPRDNYERLIRYIGEHTYIDKVNNDVVICDFTSLVKPYNEQWKEMFDMDYSEFDEEEAYYECVVNLEPIIAGNVGEKFCGEMLDIFEGRK